MNNRLRLVSLLLFASLVVNLFLGGLMAGRWLDHGPRQHHERGERKGSAPRWMQRALGPDAAPVLEEIWQSRAPILEPIRRDLDRSRAAVTDALAAEPFDPQAYAAALEDMQQLRARLYPIVNSVMTDVVSRLTPDQRQRVVERGREWERRHAGPQ